jgi:hypothetical protein
MVAACRYQITKEMRRIIRAHLNGELRTTGGFRTALDSLNEVCAEVDSTVQKLLESAKQYDEKHYCLSDLPQTESSAGGFASTPSEIFDRPWTLHPSMSSTTACQSIATFGAWAAVLLHLMMHKCFCILYQPLFFCEEALVDQAIHEDALFHARAYLQLFLHLCEHPNSAHYHWTYPRTYQPLHALSLLLADLLTSPNATSRDQQASSLSRGLIDAVFELYEVGEGIVTASDLSRRQLSPEGNQVWAMLLNARRTAFERTGQDPQVLIPFPASSTSETCMCGKKIAAGLKSISLPASPSNLSPRNIERTTLSEVESAQNADRPDEGRFDPREDDMSDMGDDEQGKEEEHLDLNFDWDTWDAVFGDFPPSLS